MSFRFGSLLTTIFLRHVPRNIQKLNKSVEDEYFRLVQGKHNPVEVTRESTLARWLGLKYLTGSDTSHLHSSTAFVEFSTFAAKQHAVQCNIAGTYNFMRVEPVPEARDIMWGNEHVSVALIVTRKSWMNAVLFVGLLLWSFIVSLVRGYDGISSWFGIEQEAIAAFLDVYVPALVVEGLVRCIPMLLRVIVPWIRFKSASATDHYILLWYFAYRLLTFIFVIVGGNIVDKTEDLLDNPLGLIRTIADNVSYSSSFFCTYIMVTGGIQIFTRFSQIHVLALYWFINRKTTKEAVSQRRLDSINTNTQVRC